MNSKNYGIRAQMGPALGMRFRHGWTRSRWRQRLDAEGNGDLVRVVVVRAGGGIDGRTD